MFFWVFLGIFTERPASASGGIWDKVSVIQRFEQAIHQKDQILAGQVLDDVFKDPDLRDLIAPTSRLFSNKLLTLDLSTKDRYMSQRFALFSKEFETVATLRYPETPKDALIKAVALNDFSNLTNSSALDSVIVKAFRAGRVPFAVGSLMEQHKLGEAILTALIQFEKGSSGDLQDLMDSLSTLRFLGLDETARRATLYLLIVGGHEH